MKYGRFWANMLLISIGCPVRSKKPLLVQQSGFANTNNYVGLNKLVAVAKQVSRINGIVIAAARQRIKW
jgi:hypothetical protein